jgi:phytoene dehydrogenase-like protein
MLPLDAPLSSAFALLLTTLAHSAGWPVVEGGSGRVTAVLAQELESLGGKIVTGCWVRSLDQVARSRIVLLDVSPDQVLALGGDRLNSRERRALSRYRYGPGVCKVDWALSGPVPWTAPACRQTCTVHVGGTFAEVARSEAEVTAGGHPERPYCIVTQPAVVDATRAPQGQHTLWAYCHVPAGSTVDMTERIENQIERFAPGFRDLVLQRVTKTAKDVSLANPTYVGGDINGGMASLRQTLFRPTVRWNPYRTGIPGTYLCSASAPPGGGVHGMCGVFAAKTALGDLGPAGDLR